MPTIRLFAEQHLPIDVKSLVSNLNARCKYLQFEAGRSRLRIDGNEIVYPASYAQLDKPLTAEAKNDLLTLLFTDKPYDSNFFFESSSHISIVSLADWEYLSSLSMNNGAVYFVADLLALEVDDSFRHEETTGCIYDFDWDKTGVDLGMRTAYVCPACRSRIGKSKLTKEQSYILFDVRQILDALGAASRWDEDIVGYWQAYEPAKRKSPSKSVSEAIPPPNYFVPEEDPNGYIDVRRTRLNLLCQRYLELTAPDLPVDKKGKAFEEFSMALFGLVKGWKRLDSDARLEDCEVDIIYDISEGPAPLRNRMGHAIYVECKHRGKKADVRDISHFVMNLKGRGLTSGIFFSFGGITGYDPINWRKATDAYRRIIEVSRQEKIYVIPLVNQDVEVIKNGKNLVSHLIDSLNRFVRV